MLTGTPCNGFDKLWKEMIDSLPATINPAALYVGLIVAQGSAVMGR